MSIASRISVWADGESPTPSEYWGLYFEAEEANVVVNMTKTGSPYAITLETSTDGETWTAFDAEGGTTPITLANIGDKVYFRAGSGGNTQLARGTSDYHAFSLSGNAKAGGNIMSLLDGDNSANVTLTKNYAFTGLFLGCNKLTAAPTMPATTLTLYCYKSTFKNCTALTVAPALPATSLVTECYSEMFYGCTALTTAPALPALTAATYCYNNMFYGCTALTTAPELPATTLAQGCYQYMFRGCSSLTQAPALSGETLAAQCYNSMLAYCSNLSSVTVSFSAWVNQTTTNWLSGVYATGTFTCPTALGTDATITRGASNCPSGWTVVNI